MGYMPRCVVNKTREDGIVVVEFIVGGAWQKYALVSDANVVVLMDSREEVAQLPDLPQLIKVPLGAEDTVLSLLERLQETEPAARALLEEYRQRPTVYLGAGMAQDPRLGACAVQDLAARGELARLFQRVFTRVLEAANGQLDLLIVRELNSNAGGMGAGGAPEVGSRFCAYAAHQTTAKIRHQALRLGALTFVAVAGQGLANARLTTAADVHRLLDEHAPAWLLRDLELYELPLRSEDGLAVRDDRGLRGLLAGTLAKARFAEGVERLLNLREVNEKSTSRFGGMLCIRAWWSKSLDQELLRRAAASTYRDQLKALQLHPDPADMAVALGIEVELDPPSAPLPTVEEVMALLRTNATSHLLDDFGKAAPQALHTTVLVRTSPAQAVFLDEVLGPPERPKTLEACRARCRRLRGVLAHLRQAHQAAHTAQTALTKECEQRRRTVQREIARLRSFRHQLDALLLPRARVLRRIQTVCEAYRTTHVRSSEACARTTALAAAVAQIEQDLAHYEGQWLTRLEQGLATMIGKRVVYLDTAVFAPLEAVYDGLLEATLQVMTGESDEQDSKAWTVLHPVLMRAVAQVTLKGLAEMLHTVPDPKAIVAALEEGRFAYASPPWGGKNCYEEPRYRFVVLPPMAAVEMAELRRTAEERHFGPTLITAETVAAGCCIVALAFYPVMNLSDVLPPLYTNGTTGPAQPGQVSLTGAPWATMASPNGETPHDAVPVAQEVSHAL